MAEVALRDATEADVEPLLAILREPEVYRWWGDETAEGLRAELDHAWVVEANGALAGLLLHYEESEPAFRHVTLDVSLRTALHARGVGRRALRLGIDHYVARGVHRFTIDPAAHNERAIRCYRAVGFRPVGVLREQWRDPDGVWRDALLLDLLASDLG